MTDWDEFMEPNSGRKFYYNAKVAAPKHDMSSKDVKQFSLKYFSCRHTRRVGNRQGGQHAVALKVPEHPESRFVSVHQPSFH